MKIWNQKQFMMFNHNELVMAEYFSNNLLSNDETKFLFTLRTKMLDVKANYGHFYGNEKSCPLCDEEDTQEHILKCHMLNKHELVTLVANHSDIYSECTDTQIKMCLMIKGKWQQRKIIEALLDEII